VCKYEGVAKSFRTGRLERELQMVQLSAIRRSCITILWVSLVSFTIITLSVASQRVFIVVLETFGYALIYKTASYAFSCYFCLLPAFSVVPSSHFMVCESEGDQKEARRPFINVMLQHFRWGSKDPLPQHLLTYLITYLLTYSLTDFMVQDII
jgi:hypothetical protein